VKVSFQFNLMLVAVFTETPMRTEVLLLLEIETKKPSH